MARKKNWKPYRLTNSTKKEVYHGVTKYSAQKRLDKSHSRGKTKAVSHWKYGSDKIEFKRWPEG